MTAVRSRTFRGHGPAGFSLVELLIVVVLAGILGSTLMSLFRIQNRAFRTENRTLEVDQNLRAGLDLVLRELRNAGMKDRLQPYAALPGILSADSTGIRFTTDFHSTTDPNSPPDGDVLDANEDIEYSYTSSDSTLRRRTRGSAGDSGPQPMAELVTRVRFDYFDADGNLLPFPLDAAALASIRRIHVSMTGAAPGGRAPSTLESDVVPRNLDY